MVQEIALQIFNVRFFSLYAHSFSQIHVFIPELSQKPHQFCSSPLSVEWSHSGYVTTCFIYRTVAVLREQRIKFTPFVWLWQRDAFLVIWQLLSWLRFGFDISSRFPATHTLCFWHLWGAVSSWLWQVAVWSPFLLAVFCNVFECPVSSSNTTWKIMMSLSVGPCPPLPLQALKWL